MARRRTMSWQARVMLAVFAVASVVFLPTTVLLFVGMLPTVVARVVDRTPERTKSLTVGFMNFAGCFPFWYQLVESGHKIDNAMLILSDPMTIVIIYASALVGYGIEMVMTVIVAGLMVQKGQSRLKSIKSHQEEMVKKWGPEVTGEIPLDQYGFPVENKKG